MLIVSTASSVLRLSDRPETTVLDWITGQTIVKKWKQFRTEMHNGETTVIPGQTNQLDSEPNLVFWQQLKLVSPGLRTGLRSQLNQNCLDVVESKTDKERWKHLLEGMILLSVIHLFGLVSSKGGIRQLVTQLVPESNL